MWDIPELRPDRLASVIPAKVYAGGAVSNPASTLFIFRTASLSKARGCVVGFYVDDERFEGLWRHPERSIDLFLKHGVRTLIEPDYSLWSDAPLVEQLWSTYRTRSLGRLWQDAGLSVIPNLSWSDERSFPFCFAGIPPGAPLVACECRTPGSCDEDRRRFLAGLAEGVRQTQPAKILIYGGASHKFWLDGNLPQGLVYHLIDSWTDARGKVRKSEKRQEQEKNQLKLFGGTQWADVDRQAA